MKTFKIPFVMGAMVMCILPSCGLKKEKMTPAPAVRVSVLPVADSSVGRAQAYSGVVESGDGSELSFSVPGTIQAIYVTPGQKVAKGQLLAELGHESLDNAAAVADAALEEAQDAYARLKKLHDAQALPDIKWVEMQSKLKQAENTAAMAHRAVADAKIYAPQNGTVAEKLADVGQTVIPALPVLRIVGLGDVKVSISVPEGEIAAMKPGRKASVTVDAVGGEPRQATLTEQGVTANPLTRAYDVKFSVANPGSSLLPGMLCSVSLDEPQEALQAIVLPTQAVLLAADNRHFVWLAKEGKAHRRFVEQKGVTPSGIIIASGIASGDNVITAGMQKVSENTPVTVID